MAAAAPEASATGRSHQRQGATPISRATAARSLSRALCDGEGTSGWVSSWRFSSSRLVTHFGHCGRCCSICSRTNGALVPKW